MRLPDTAHTDRPWRIHEVAADMELHDVWALPTPGGPDDFPRLVRLLAEGDPADNPSAVARLLFAVRWRLGELLGWDDPRPDAPTLLDRLPADLRDGPRGPASGSLPFTPLYLTDDECAAEVSNATVHAVLHHSWVPDGAGGFRGQLAVLVRPRGRLGAAYMALIAPFRHWLVYPPMMRGIARAWEQQEAAQKR